MLFFLEGIKILIRLFCLIVLLVMIWLMGWNVIHGFSSEDPNKMLTWLVKTSIFYNDYDEFNKLNEKQDRVLFIEAFGLFFSIDNSLLSFLPINKMF